MKKFWNEDSVFAEKPIFTIINSIIILIIIMIPAFISVEPLRHGSTNKAILRCNMNKLELQNAIAEYNNDVKNEPITEINNANIDKLINKEYLKNDFKIDYSCSYYFPNGINGDIKCDYHEKEEKRIEENDQLNKRINKSTKIVIIICAFIISISFLFSSMFIKKKEPKPGNNIKAILIILLFVIIAIIVDYFSSPLVQGRRAGSNEIIYHRMHWLYDLFHR